MFWGVGGWFRICVGVYMCLWFRICCVVVVVVEFGFVEGGVGVDGGGNW